MLVLASVGVSIMLNVAIVLPMIPLTVLFLYTRRYFLTSSMEIKRIEGIGKWFYRLAIRFIWDFLIFFDRFKFVVRFTST